MAEEPLPSSPVRNSGNNSPEKKVSRNLSSFECHEISRLYKHLNKVTRLPSDLHLPHSILCRGTLSPQKQETATNALDTLIKRVAHIVALSIRSVDENLEVFSLDAFASLEELYLNKVPPSTISDFFALRDKLRKLDIVSSGIPELAKLLTPIKQKYLNSMQPMLLFGKIPKIKPSYIWNKLTHLRLTNCGLTRLDPSLHFLPALISLDISYNEISHIVHLHDCLSLKVLNVSHNRISVLSNLIWVIPNIQRLNLSYNQIESLDGVDKLHQLQKLDLSHNRLSDFREIQSLSQLRSLSNIYLLGNTLATKPNYRLHVVSQFLNDCSLDGRELPNIDGKSLSPKESYTLKSTIFLPPEISLKSTSNGALFEGYTSSRLRLGVLIGNIAVYGDDIPIHELDMIFDAGGEKFSESIGKKSLETQHAVMSPGNKGSQLLWDNPERAAELLHRVQSPKIAKNSRTINPSKSLGMIRKTRLSHLVDIEDEDRNNSMFDISATFSELSRFGVGYIASGSPLRESKIDEPSHLPVPRAPQMDGELIPSSNPQFQESSQGDSHEDVLNFPVDYFHQAQSPIESSSPSESNEISSNLSLKQNLEIPVLQEVEISPEQECDRESLSETSSTRRISSRWSKSRAHQYSLSLLDSPPNTTGFAQGTKIEGADVASLYSSDELQLSGIKSTSSAVKSQEPEELEDQSETLKDMKNPIPSYTGSVEFVNLSISDNLEKYFLEQVFGHGRPSGEAPYMQYESLSKNIQDHNGYVEIPFQSERMIALYREKAIEISNGQLASSPERRASRPKSSAQKSSSPIRSLVFVLTDIHLYVVLDNFSSLQKFVDAPIPIARRVHPIESCRSCTHYFGFQRCTLNFFEESIHSSLSVSPTITYMILTKDKSRTHPIITTIPNIANIQRALQQPPLPKVSISNKDSQLLDRVAEIIINVGGSEIDIIFSQLLSQIWKQKPGYSEPKTLILTPQRLLLCEEDLTCEDVKLSLLDHVQLKEIYKIRPEDDPLKLTLIMKPQGKVGITKRKWRLMGHSAIIIAKITEDIRRAIGS